ncbi:EamA family transporter [filamentous cyanobacterium CCP5]|nr:EamA family transporter [filamentous cyanobacterium CCP5]
MNQRAETFAFSGRVYLMTAVLIFGAANAVTRKLTEIGAANFTGGSNPVSFCNVLFVGNLCALVMLALLYRRQCRLPALRQIPWKQWLTLTLVATLSAAIVPTLIFTALSVTAVNNVVLISQIDTPLVLALSVVLLGDRVNTWVALGASLAFVGVALTVLLQPATSDRVAMGSGFQIGLGELLTLLAAVFKAISDIISKISLQHVPLGIFNVFRMLVGTVVFFTATAGLYGPEHFMDVASPFLWQWMVIYSAVIVVGGQLAWFSGLKQSSASEISLAAAFNPLVGVIAAYLILSEAPTLAQYIGGGVILIGIACNQIGLQRLAASQALKQPSAAEMYDKVTYKGV